MLEQLKKELEELQKYKKEYEYALKDKQTMSEMLYEYMMKEYENTTYEERVSKFKQDTCECCRFGDGCNLEIPDDIMKPIPSKKAWIPATKSCGEFEWA